MDEVLVLQFIDHLMELFSLDRECPFLTKISTFIGLLVAVKCGGKFLNLTNSLKLPLLNLNKYN